ncbi:2-hydroxy-3-keto-5-methylthiopentenyl-1-phosphate phosphatase [Paenibacillus sp. GCM10012307]|uniref:2-hydroxy-3-keto-5-methylthiopentenyl-1-phosphate phosphatase n=1 Tax=Paenibacillus roseus TaxID=2798579 RepID=A0A934MMP6_9BACL|nr:2-hydroxy-3-keto-5-methylthiopentenyl-1-phosphate phosphatase [Paenibacillus roseus]MBJ6363580.1 2-hydroxy-3-keto-5-methylthiopentenyl-1-phosphate phosphatase [Paenibacillus roseus]
MSQSVPREKVVFCDFDGTITENDNIIAIIKHFNPDGWEKIANDVITERKSIRQGVSELFRLLPAAMQKEVVDYAVTNVRIRSGFQELLNYCKQQQILFYVTSGGIDFFIYPVLSAFDIPEERIFCNGSDFTGERVEITWPHPCDDQCSNHCGMCKPTIMRRFDPAQYERIIIGDSVTDFEGAKLADLVFSRSHLTEKCKELGLPYIPYETFHDVVAHLQRTSSLLEERND